MKNIFHSWEKSNNSLTFMNPFSTKFHIPINLSDSMLRKYISSIPIVDALVTTIESGFQIKGVKVPTVHAPVTTIESGFQIKGVEMVG